MLVERRESPIQGNGVFAKDFIEEDHWQYIYGEVIPLQAHPMEHYCFEHEDGMYLPYAPFCWANHSENPNCEYGWDEEEEVYFIIAARDIQPDEELTIDYGFTP